VDVAIIKYNGGNTRSVLYALERLGITATVTNDAEQIRKADKVIFPGVGEAGSAMAFLKQRELDKLIKQLTQPVLGICLGMQLMCSHSEESNTDCLGIFDVPVVRFTGEKVPHMGWNTVSAEINTPLLKNITYDYFYFVHGFFVPVSVNTLATTFYGTSFSSILQKKNFYGVQFHPEKSSGAGSTLIKNFVEL
jgi:glutamine amidotransferase